MDTRTHNDSEVDVNSTLIPVETADEEREISIDPIRNAPTGIYDPLSPDPVGGQFPQPIYDPDDLQPITDEPPPSDEAS
jgi:hypothetical protein